VEVDYIVDLINDIRDEVDRCRDMVSMRSLNLKAAELQIMEKAIEVSKTKEQAAKILGISARTLRNRKL